MYELIIIIIELVLIGIWWLILRSIYCAVIVGIACYIVIAYTLRLAFQKHHRKGMALMRNEQYAAAA
ncbi:MAG: hypothetical protein ACI4II_03820 [Acutalibacteraceae bacterium]